MTNIVTKILIYPKLSAIQLSTHFNISELECPCTDCKVTIVAPDLVVLLESMRTILGSKIHINSGYRCQSYQDQLKLRGAETAIGVSQHTQGCAADVGNGVTSGMELEDAARKAGFRAVGRASTWVHVDLRADKDRSWSYKA